MTISVEDAAARLPELLDELPAGPITLTRGGAVVAQIVLHESGAKPKKVRQLGTMQGTVLYMADDFDAPLDEFKEYCP